MCKILQETSVMDDGSLLSSEQNFFSHLLNGVEQRISSHGMTSEVFIICFAHKLPFKIACKQCYQHIPNELYVACFHWGILY